MCLDWCIPIRSVVSRLGCTDWASEASPTLGCSIEISHDIYNYISVLCLRETHTKSSYIKNCEGRIT